LDANVAFNLEEKIAIACKTNLLIAKSNSKWYIPMQLDELEIDLPPKSFIF
jgi:hypothetical protein